MKKIINGFTLHPRVSSTPGCSLLSNGNSPRLRQGGFTLVEILIAVAILVLTLSMTLPVASGLRKSAKGKAVDAEINAVITEARLYHHKYRTYLDMCTSSSVEKLLNEINRVSKKSDAATCVDNKGERAGDLWAVAVDDGKGNYYCVDSSNNFLQGNSVYNVTDGSCLLGVSPNNITYYGVTSQAGMNGVDGGWAVFFGSDPGESLHLAIDEDENHDPERSHTTEQVGYWLIKSVGENSSIEDYLENKIGEFGYIDNVGDTWTTVLFNSGALANNVRIVTSVRLDDADHHPVVARIKDISGTGFKVKLQNPDDAPVGPTRVYYLAVNYGWHTLKGGTRLVASSVGSTKFNSKSEGWHMSEVEKFDTPWPYTYSLANPVVFTQLIGDNNWSVPWVSDGVARQHIPITDKMYIGRHIGEKTAASVSGNTVHIIAVDASTGTMDNGVKWSAAVGSRSIPGVDNGGGTYNITFP